MLQNGLKTGWLKRATEAVKGNDDEGALDKGLSPVPSAMSLRIYYAC